MSIGHACLVRQSEANLEVVRTQATLPEISLCLTVARSRTYNVEDKSYVEERLRMVDDAIIAASVQVSGHDGRNPKWYRLS